MFNSFLWILFNIFQFVVFLYENKKQESILYFPLYSKHFCVMLRCRRGFSRMLMITDKAAPRKTILILLLWRILK